MKWDDDKGWGFLRATEPCTKDYWSEYRKLDRTPLGRVLTAIRAGMVYKHCAPLTNILDVGIGGGAFVAETKCFGIDINEHALDWLRRRNLLWSQGSLPIMTFWDSLEHLPNPGEYLSRATEHVFISTPIYHDEAHARASKHYKPNEHLWYFTDQGLHLFMREYAFKCVEQSTLETDAGREGIGSYVFRRT